MRIKSKESIGLVIDMQKRLFPAMDQKEVLIENCRKLLTGLNLLGLEIITTQQYTKGLGETLDEVTSLLHDFDPIEKKTFSCLDEPMFVHRLETKNKENVIICGIESHVCVLQTAIDLKEAGYVPVVVFDCVSSRNDKDKQLALERFHKEGIILASYESILFELTRGAHKPVFKDISKLVK